MSKNKNLIRTIIFAAIFYIILIILYIYINTESQKSDSAFRRSFETKIKEAIKCAKQQWMMDNANVDEVNEKIYSSCENGCYNNIESFDIRSSFHYYIYLDDSGIIKKYMLLMVSFNIIKLEMI